MRKATRVSSPGCSGPATWRSLFGLTGSSPSERALAHCREQIVASNDVGGSSAGEGESNTGGPGSSRPGSGSDDVPARDRLSECCPPFRRAEGICKVLRLVHHMRVGELHNAQRSRWAPRRSDDALAYPQIPAADDPEDGELPTGGVPATLSRDCCAGPGIVHLIGDSPRSRRPCRWRARLRYPRPPMPASISAVLPSSGYQIPTRCPSTCGRSNPRPGKATRAHPEPWPLLSTVKLSCSGAAGVERTQSRSSSPTGVDDVERLQTSGVG